MQSGIEGGRLRHDNDQDTKTKKLRPLRHQGGDQQANREGDRNPCHNMCLGRVDAFTNRDLFQLSNKLCH